MKTLLIICILLIILFAIYMYKSNANFINCPNKKLLSNLQNLDKKYNKNVIRGKNGRFEKI